MESQAIIDIFLEPLADLGVKLILGFDAAGVRKESKRLFGSHHKELLEWGVKREQLGNAEGVIWDSLASTVAELTYEISPRLWWILLQTQRGIPPEEHVQFTAEDLKPFLQMTEAERSAFGPAAFGRDFPSELWLPMVQSRLVPKVSTAIGTARALPFQYVSFIHLPFPTEFVPVLGDETTFGRNSVARGCENQVFRIHDEIDPSDLSFSGSETWQQRLHQPAWTEDFYFSHGFDGYIGGESNGEPVVTAARDELKSLLGLCVACDLLEVHGDPAWDHVEPIYIFASEGNDQPLRWLPVDESAVMGSMRAELPSEERLLEKKRVWHAISAALRRGDDRLRNAARWLFESYCGSNGLLKFVQATVSLEILLGDKGDSSDVGIQKLLANRVAYLIASSASEREALLTEVKAIYKVRSSIVHSGGDELGRELQKLDRLRWIVKRVLQRELVLFSVV